MADIADYANDLAQTQLDILLATRAKPSQIEFTGFCLNCDEHLPRGPAGVPPLRWCDEDCRDDHQARMKLTGGHRA